MKKLLILIVFLLSALGGYSQGLVDATYITYKDDTVHTKIAYKTIGRHIDPMSFKGRIKTVNGAETIKIKEADVKYLELYFSEGKWVFTSKAIEPELPVENRLYRMYNKGKLTWCRDYYYNQYALNEIEYFYFKGHEPHSVSIFGSIKRTLKKLIGESRPDLIPVIDDMRTNTRTDREQSVTALLEDYNKTE